MKLFTFVFLGVLGTVFADTSKWTDFRVKYSPVSTGVGVDAFWPVMKTLNEAHLHGWTTAQLINPLGCSVLCYRTDHRLCALYDGRGTIAGMMLLIPVTDVEGHNIPYDFNNFPVYEKKSIRNVSYWTSTYYLVDPEVILAGGRPHNVTQIGEGLWIKSGDTYDVVPTDLQSIKDDTLYTWQNCIPSMGIHYYYNMTVNTRCEDTQPFFLLVKDDNLVGLGWQFNGRTTPVIRNYYDDINSVAVKATVPLSPPCLAEGADEYGVISIHMYFVENPWNIPCNQSIDSVVPIPGLP